MTLFYSKARTKGPMLKLRHNKVIRRAIALLIASNNLINIQFAAEMKKNVLYKHQRSCM